MYDTSTLRTVFDELEETKGDDECSEWIGRLLDAKPEPATFVAKQRGRGRVIEYVGFLKGSFNISLRLRFDDDGPDAIIRFPKPGHTATSIADEKVTNEVAVMKYLSEYTTIPIPRMHAWGLSSENPHGLGPFIIMDFVEGVLLADVLKQLTESDQDPYILDPTFDQPALDRIYEQIAGYLLQLSRLEFSKIGAITNDDSKGWAVTRRPLTYNMNELISISGCTADVLLTSTFDRASQYLDYIAQQHLIHLRTQRNIARDPKVAKARFIARHRLAQLIPEHCIEDDTGPFLLFCDDLRPANILADPETYNITAVIDFEFNNVVPAQYSYSPPWWLLLSGPDHWLESGSIDEFRRLYVPRLEQFLRAMERVEGEEGAITNGKRSSSRLSTRMRASWESGRFWFYYASRSSFDLDTVYWAALHKDEHGDGLELLDEKTRAELEPFVEEKMRQLKSYDRECDERFNGA